MRLLLWRATDLEFHDYVLHRVLRLWLLLVDRTIRSVSTPKVALLANLQLDQGRCQFAQRLCALFIAFETVRSAFERAARVVELLGQSAVERPARHSQQEGPDGEAMFVVEIGPISVDFQQGAGDLFLILFV